MFHYSIEIEKLSANKQTTSGSLKPFAELVHDIVLKPLYRTKRTGMSQRYGFNAGSVHVLHILSTICDCYTMNAEECYKPELDVLNGLESKATEEQHTRKGTPGLQDNLDLKFFELLFSSITEANITSPKVF